MHQEVLKPKVISAPTNYCLLALIALTALFIAPLVQHRLHPLGQYGVYAMVAVAVLVVVKWQLTQYHYSIIANELIFERKLGKRTKKLAVVNLSNVCAFGTYRELKGEQMKTHVYTMKPKACSYALIVEQDSQMVRIVFHPSEKMVRCIAHRIACEQADALAQCEAAQ